MFYIIIIPLIHDLLEENIYSSLISHQQAKSTLPIT